MLHTLYFTRCCTSKYNLRDLTQVVAMFDTGESFDELENILEIINDAWNYFPHKILDGLFPAEKILEYQKKKK
jgi:hypothetical protein